VNRFSLRLLAFFRRISPLDKIALAILFIYVVMRVASAVAQPVPLTGFVGFLSFLAAAYLIVRLIPWVRNTFMWTLRNRLLVAYVFIAVVPVILLLTMVGVASYLLYLELGAHLLHDDLQDRVSIIATESESIANAVAHEADEAGVKTVDESMLQRPSVAEVIMAAKTDWPDLRVRLNAGQRLLQAGNGSRFSGLAEQESKLWFAAAEKRETDKGSFTLVVSAPVTPELLDGFRSELGPIEVVLWRPAVPGATTTQNTAKSPDSASSAAPELSAPPPVCSISKSAASPFSKPPTWKAARNRAPCRSWHPLRCGHPH
jgi:hypothetical protein